MYEQPAATSLEPAVYIEQRKPRKTKRGLDPQTARDTEADDLEAEDINDQQPPAKALKIQAAASVEGEDSTALAAGAKRKPKSKAKKPQAKDSDGPTAAKSSKPKAKAKAKALKAAPAEGKDSNDLAAAAGESQPEGKAKDPNPNDEPKRKAKDEALEPPRQTAEAEDDPARDLGDEAMSELVKLSVDELCTLHGAVRSPAWVSVNNVYSNAYRKALTRAKLTVAQARLRARVASAIWRRGGCGLFLKQLCTPFTQPRARKQKADQAADPDGEAEKADDIEHGNVENARGGDAV